jgi:hypothetical protein
MDHKIRCAHCRRLFRPDPRVKNQSYCGNKVCQRARKTLWQRKKMATDPDYQANQRDCQKRWYKQHPDYWRNYRADHPDYCKQNCLMQRDRDKGRRFVNLAKMDASKQISSFKPNTYYLIHHLAKMDALTQKVLIIPTV